MGKKEFFSLVVLDVKLLYLRPEGRSEQSMLGVGGVFEDGGSSPVDSAVVDTPQRGQWSPGDLRS